MSGTVWTKFFWSDWESEPALRLCSYAAQGLWMRMLCIAAAHDPIGYVAVAGRGLDETSIARMTGGLESEVRDLLGELERNGVFSRDRQGRIYSRRMISDAKKAAIAKKNGKKGGNPSLGKDKGNSASDNPPDNTWLKTQEPEANIQNTPVAPKGAGKIVLRQAHVEEAWNVTPPKARARTSKADVMDALKAAAQRGKRPEDVIDGLRAYYRSSEATREDGQYAKGAHRIIAKDRWESFVGERQAPAANDEPSAEDVEARWDRRVAEFRKAWVWNEIDWGPKPNRPGCKVDPEILAKHGYGKAEGAAA